MGDKNRARKYKAYLKVLNGNHLCYFCSRPCGKDAYPGNSMAVNSLCITTGRWHVPVCLRCLHYHGFDKTVVLSQNAIEDEDEEEVTAESPNREPELAPWTP